MCFIPLFVHDVIQPSCLNYLSELSCGFETEQRSVHSALASDDENTNSGPSVLDDLDVSNLG
jgi:hypothetical protein